MHVCIHAYMHEYFIYELSSFSKCFSLYLIDFILFYIKLSNKNVKLN